MIKYHYFLFIILGNEKRKNNLISLHAKILVDTRHKRKILLKKDSYNITLHGEALDIFLAKSLSQHDYYCTIFLEIVAYTIEF